MNYCYPCGVIHSVREAMRHGPHPGRRDRVGAAGGPGPRKGEDVMRALRLSLVALLALALLSGFGAATAWCRQPSCMARSSTARTPHRSGCGSIRWSRVISRARRWSTSMRAD